MMRVYAYVREQDEPVFVTTLNDRAAEELGDTGLEKIVRDWCGKQTPPLTFVDYA